jgi:hypothetical protein
LGSLLLAAGQHDTARTVLTEGLAAATRIGHSSLTASIRDLLDEIPTMDGEQ